MDCMKQEDFLRALFKETPAEGHPYGNTEGPAIVLWDVADPGYLTLFLPFRQKDPIQTSDWIRLTTFGWPAREGEPPELSYCMGPLSDLWFDEGSEITNRVKGGLEIALALGLADKDGCALPWPEVSTPS